MKRIALLSVVVLAVLPWLATDWPVPVRQLTVRDALWKLTYNVNRDLPHIHHGRVWLTAYCSCPICTGRSSPDIGGHGLTASGTLPEPHFTVAADTSVYPMGTILELNGHVRVRVEDTGSLINGPHLDVYLGNSSQHVAAADFGIRRFVDAVRVQ